MTRETREVRFCTSAELGEREVMSRLLDELPVAVARYDGFVFAFGALCPHQHADLGEGILDERGIACPQHLWHFDLATGQCAMVPEASIPTYRARERDGVVYVELPAT